MNYCRSCGAPLAECARFCPRCGQPVPPKTDGTGQPQAEDHVGQEYQQQQFNDNQAYGPDYQGQPYGGQQQYGFKGNASYGQSTTLSQLDTWFEETLSHICKGQTLQVGMITCVALDAIAMIIVVVLGNVNRYAGAYLNIDLFSSVLYAIPSMLAELAGLFVFLHLFDCCYKRGIRNPLFSVYTIAILAGCVFLVLGCAAPFAMILAFLFIVGGWVLNLIFSLKLVNTELGLIFKVNLGYAGLCCVLGLLSFAAQTLSFALGHLCAIGLTLFIYFKLKPIYESWSENNGYNVY